jgi:uncharacterized protein YegP (UPF0339 family)
MNGLLGAFVGEFEILDAQGGGFFWRLKAGNGQTLCHSEVYTTKQAAQGGIEAVKRVAPTAPVQDRTRSKSLYGY